jgi:fructose-1,6-bisphosphatase/inositol monophosphatase family enzyme
MPLPDPRDLAAVIDALLPALRAAGDEVMAIYRSDFAVRGKADASPVTEADERAESLLVPAIEALGLGWPVVAEEACSRDGPPAVGERFWLVDPLDGTRWAGGGRPALPMAARPQRRRTGGPTPGHTAARAPACRSRPGRC